MNAILKVADLPSVSLRDIPRKLYIELQWDLGDYLRVVDSINSDDLGAALDFVPVISIPSGAKFTRFYAFTDSSLILIDHQAPMINIQNPLNISDARIQVSVQINISMLKHFIYLVLHSVALKSHYGFIQSGAIEVSGSAVVLFGWPASGKTESVLEFVKRGYNFISDEWSIISDSCQVHGLESKVWMSLHDISFAPQVARAYYGNLRGSFLAWYGLHYAPPNVGTTRSMFMSRRVVQLLLRRLVRVMGMKTKLQVKADMVCRNRILEFVPVRLVYLLMRVSSNIISLSNLSPYTFVSHAMANYRYELRKMLDPDQLQFAFPNQEVGLGLGIHSDKVQAILTKAFTQPHVKTFAVEIPVSASPRELVSYLETHINQELG